jgi:Secretion system C-terminal sorting domain
MKRKMLLLTLAIPVILCQGVQAQTASRLTGSASWANNGAQFNPVDSSSFKYSSGRGGDLTHIMKYDNATTWDYLGDTAFSNAFYYIQTFDANNNITSTIKESWNGSMWVLDSNTLYTYNTSNQVTTMIRQYWSGGMWQPASQDVYSYNIAGKMYLDQYQVWNSLTTMFEASTQKTFYYDGSSNLINETDQMFVMGVPVYTNQWAYTYTGTNQLLTTTYNTWNGAGWSPMTMSTNTYDTTGNITNTLFQTYNTVTTAWVNSMLHIYSNFTGGHMPQQNIMQTWDTTGGGSWMNVMKFTYSYNSYNQMTKMWGQSWNIVGIFEFADGDPMANYYYETYTPGTINSVKTVVSNGGEANVYPVPAQNTLNVDVKWNEAQSAKISIYDVQGKVVRNWEVPTATAYHSSVSVGNLGAGTYFIKISGAQGEIVKQFVVAH